MLFNSIRNNRNLKLMVLFGFAAAAPLQGLPRESPEVSELRVLATEYASDGAFMSPRKFDRFSELMKRLGNPSDALSALNAAGFCAHGSGGSGGGIAGPAATACPDLRRRLAKGDHSHLLAIHYWL